MKHRILVAFLALITIGLLIGVGGYWEWPGSQLQSPSQPQSTVHPTPGDTPTATTTSLGQILPRPRLGPASAEAAPTVTWTPASVDAVVGQGQTTTVSVSFVSSANLSNVTVRVVPGIQPFVHTTPTSFTSISKGQQVTLTLTMSASASASLATASGTIQLKSGSATIARSLPVTVEVWKTFREQTGQYSLSFPPYLDAQVIGGALILRTVSADGEEVPALSFLLDPNPTALPLEQYYDGDPGRDLIGQSDGEFTNLVVGGLPAFKFVPTVSFAGEVVVLVPLVDNFLRITDDGSSFQDTGLLERILGTVRF